MSPIGERRSLGLPVWVALKLGEVISMERKSFFFFSDSSLFLKITEGGFPMAVVTNVTWKQ